MRTAANFIHHIAMSLPLYANLAKPEYVLALHVLNAISMFPRPGSLLPPRVRRLSVAFKLTPVNAFIGIVDIVDSALIKGLLVLGIRS